MSMAAHRASSKRFGSCVAYGPPIGIGLPIEVNLERPLVVAHPAAAMHYHASLGLLEDAGHPFIQFMVDWGDYNPLYSSSFAAEVGMQTYQRMPDTSYGDGVYRKASLSLPHWQIHAVGEAYNTLTNRPPIDILYVDWLSWLSPEPLFDEDKDEPMHPTFANKIGSIVHKIREGGLVIMDHKHKQMSEGEHPWYDFGNSPYLHLSEHTLLHNEGMIEWLAADVDGDYVSHSATVFKVHHGIEGELAMKDWEQAMQPWFWSTVPEMALQLQQVETLLEIGKTVDLHTKAPTSEEWMDSWMRAMEQQEHGLSCPPLPPQPPSQAWSKDAYTRFLQWLIQHPTLLAPTPPTRSYTLLGENFTLELIHGDIKQLAHMLHTPQSVLALRAGLSQAVIGRCPWWLGQSLVLQSSASWSSNPVKNLTWSGEKATPMLAKHMLEHAKLQTQSGLYPSVKSMKVNHVVTVSHGTASLGELMEACEKYHATAPEYTLYTPMKLTVVCLDNDDYSDIETALPSFRFLPNDGSWGD